MKFKYLFYFIYIFILLLVPCYLLMGAYSSSTVSIANRVRIINSKDIESKVWGILDFSAKDGNGVGAAEGCIAIQIDGWRYVIEINVSVVDDDAVASIRI